MSAATDLRAPAWHTVGWNTPGSGPVPLFRGLVWALQCAHDDGARFTITSADRRRGVAERYGHSSQYALYQAFLAGRGYPANPPGRSSHELRSDGNPVYRVPAGHSLAPYMLGIDAIDDGSSNDCSRLLWHLQRVGFHVARPYHTGAEAHHFLFTQDPSGRARRILIGHAARHVVLRRPPRRHPAPRRLGPRRVAHELIGAGTEGIDVSGANGSIDWGPVRRSHHRFAYMKVSEGDWPDPSFTAGRVRAARHAGILPGGYVYLRPRAGRTGAEEFRWFWRWAQRGGLYTRGSGWALRPVIDLEASALSPRKTLRYVGQAVEECLHVNAGRHPVLYTGFFWRDQLGDPNERFGCELWYPSYPKLQGVPHAWHGRPSIHQYSETGRVPGINGRVDLDRYLGHDLLGTVAQHD